MHAFDLGTQHDDGVYALYRAGHDYLSSGHPEQAVEAFERAVEREPEKASLREALGRAYFAIALVERAQAEFERAVELEPVNDYAHFGLGRCHERQGHLPAAAKHLKLACALSDVEDYRFALNRVLLRMEA